MPTVAEKAHMAAVAEAGCCVCRLHLGVYSPASIHHCGTYMGGGRDNMRVIALCPRHHQTGGVGVALHANKARFEEAFGTEEELLNQ
tara:strand:+ start:233 stop:493 length:261 start_codon:yes stop_codon:yes gene_type:complete